MTHSSDINSRASRLRDARIAAGFKSAQAAAAAVGINPVTARSHEAGQNGFPITTAERYARVYGVSAEWLMFGEGGGSPDLGEAAALAMRAAKSEAAVKHIRATLLKLVADLDAIG